MHRRQFLEASAAATLVSPTIARRRGDARTRLILLGTAGGPRPRRTRAAPAQVILVDNSAYVIDCGNGVARQLTLANVSLRSLRHLFITHHHSDHNADYGTLLLLAWAAGLNTPVSTWGPPPLTAMTRQFLDFNAEDIRVRTGEEGRPPLESLVKPNELISAGVVFDDGLVRVTAALVDHPPFTTAFGYRFDTPDRSIVISGDTRRSQALIHLAQGADILVHEAMYPSAIDRLVAGVPNAPRLKESVLGHHTPVVEVGALAQAAGVGTLVLSHLVPAEDSALTDAMWFEAARTHFRGNLWVGRDLLEL